MVNDEGLIMLEAALAVFTKLQTWGRQIFSGQTSTI